MKINIRWSLAIAAVISLVSVFLMLYSENLPYNFDPHPTCDRSKYSCEAQIVRSDRFGESYEYCGNSVCDYPKIYDARSYGGFGALAIALISYGYLTFTLVKKRLDPDFHKAYWLLVAAIPIGWVGVVILYFSIYPS